MKPHYHINDEGFMIKCYHKTKIGVKETLGSVGFWIGLTLGYPIEHYIWEHCWPFVLLTNAISSGH